MNERLTWEEIKLKYPDQWIGLTDVEYKPENDASIKSGVVTYIGKNIDELTELQFDTKGEVLAVYTTPDNALQLGIMEVFNV
jgi:hypothetical protein